MSISTLSAEGYVYFGAVLAGIVIAIYLLFVVPFLLREPRDPDERKRVLYLPIAAIVIVIAVWVALEYGEVEH